MWETIFQASKPAWLAVTSGQGEAFVPNKFHDHLDHVLVGLKSQQLAGKATVPNTHRDRDVGILGDRIIATKSVEVCKR